MPSCTLSPHSLLHSLLYIKSYSRLHPPLKWFTLLGLPLGGPISPLQRVQPTMLRLPR